jgi:protein-disulfide isomerase
MFTAKAVLRTALSFGILIGLVSGQTLGQAPPVNSPAQQKANSDEDVRREIRELKQGQEAIQKELQELKRLVLAREAAARPVRPEKVSIGSRPFRGSEGARVVMIEFSDYQCPFCGRFYRDTLPLVDKEYIQAGKVKYVFNNLPLDDLHPAAFKAAQAVECAGDQGKFWDLHGRLFANQNILASIDWAAQAKVIGLAQPQFDQCLQSGKTEAAVRAGVEQAGSLGIQATPTFVIGLVDAKNPADPNIKILTVIGGAYPFQVFKAALDKALATL